MRKDVNPHVQLFKHGGKEFDQMHGLNWYDFDARMYDPLLGRFHTVDPLAEKYYSISPYAYCANNPLIVIDPTGMDTTHVAYNMDNKDFQVQANLRGGDDIIVVDNPLPEVTVETKAIQKPGNGTVAKGYSITVITEAGMSIEGTPNYVVEILKGPDEGKKIYLNDIQQGVGGLNIGGNYNYTLYSYIGDIETFGVHSFEGKSTFESSSVGVFIGSMSFGSSKSKTSDGILKGRTISLGIGLGLPMSISTGTTTSKLRQDRNTSNKNQYPAFNQRYR
ncbi:MAG: RHS repeat-associated core domain-containing protein [Dysgonomonas sp.]